MPELLHRVSPVVSQRAKIDVLSLIAALDTEFQLTIRPEDLQRFGTVGDIAEYVEAHTGSAPSGTPQSF